MELLLSDSEPDKLRFLSTGNILTHIYRLLVQKETLRSYIKFRNRIILNVMYRVAFLAVSVLLLA
jgi:hypothetical protein